MGNPVMKHVEEWLERARHDVETAQLLIDGEGYTDAIAYHIQQAIEKYLKGLLVYHEEKPPRVHELEHLLSLVVKYDDDLSVYSDLCEKASAFYIEDRYPPGPLPEYPYEEIKKDLERTWELVNAIERIIAESL
jgi:HEPN domain-containing protein